MPSFKFRLQKLLEYRQLQEKWAKDAWLEATARKMESEKEVDALEKRKKTSLSAQPCALDERLALDSYVTRIEDEIRAAEAAVSVLANEVEEALQEWNRARQDAEAMGKLREAEYEQWTLDETRREQAELVEWSVLMRAS